MPTELSARSVIKKFQSIITWVLPTMRCGLNVSIRVGIARSIRLRAIVMMTIARVVVENRSPLKIGTIRDENVGIVRSVAVGRIGKCLVVVKPSFKHNHLTSKHNNNYDYDNTTTTNDMEICGFLGHTQKKYNSQFPLLLHAYKVDERKNIFFFV